MKAVINWLDNRTGFRKIVHEALFENIPGGSRWRYVWGSTLTFCLVVQFITGIFLWMAYSPSSQTAWESVYYIEHQLQGGSILRGIHHYTAHAMVVLLVLHLMQVVIDGAYKAPREVNFWFGVGLLLLVMGLGLTGYLLPWDQKGYWATKVATSISATTPGVGPEVQKLVVGGTEYGHHTLTRFFALHAGVLPGAIIFLLVGHIYLFRRHGITPKEPKRKQDAAFWPDQVFKDAVACLAVLAAVLTLTLVYGAELTAPADPAENYAAARPEWYFMFLFEMLKYFPGESEVWGAIILPGFTVLLVCLMPFIGRWKLGHWFNLGVLWALICGAGLLTWMAYKADRDNPGFVAAAKQAHKDADRVKELAGSPTGIPSSGAITLLRNDPYTQGPKLFSKHCASCHRFDGHDGLGEMPTDPQSAPDLKGFGSRAWLAGLLDPAHVSGPKYFGGTKFADTKMAKFVKKDVAAFTPEQKAQLNKVIAALSAEAKLKSQADVDAQESALIAEGRTLFAHEDMRCAECHEFHKVDEDATGPDLTGYASKEWLTSFLANPKHERFYGSRNDRMPAFGDDKLLDAQSMALLADWLRGDWYVAPPAK